jgi:hypothetical protein
MRPPAIALPPKTVLVAMGIAIGGAVVSAVLSSWGLVTGLDPSHSLATYWLIVSLGLVLLNAGLLFAMSLHRGWAWVVTCALVIIGAISDLVVFTPLAVRLGYGLLFLSPVWLLGTNSGLFWLRVHVVLVEIPILVLLVAPSSRRWFELGKPASSRNSETRAW